MNFLRISAIASILTLTAATSALAGSTSNTWTNGTEKTTTKVKVDNVRVESGSFERLTENLKIDAVTEPGGFAQASINVQNGVFNGSGIANINNGVDPYVNAGRSYNLETGSFSDVSSTKVNQITESFDRVRSHTLETSF